MATGRATTFCPLVHLVRQHAAKQCRIGGGVSLAEPKKVANHAAFAIVDQLNLTRRLALLVDDRDFLEMTEQSGRFQQRILEVLRRLVRRQARGSDYRCASTIGHVRAARSRAHFSER